MKLRVLLATIVALALSSCGDDVVFAVELRLEAGQAVADLETSKIYNGPGTFTLERRGAELESLRAFRLAVYQGNNMATHEQVIGPKFCYSNCVNLGECDPDDIRIEQQRWSLDRSVFQLWALDSGRCVMADGTQTIFVQ